MDADIIDLVAVAGACRPLVTWWHEFSLHGDASPSELERARSQLATLAPMPGRLGRAIDRIVSAESQANSGQVLAAMELLGRIVACGSRPVTQGPDARDTTGKRRDGHTRCQPALPGFE